MSVLCTAEAQEARSAEMLIIGPTDGAVHVELTRLALLGSGARQSPRRAVPVVVREINNGDVEREDGVELHSLAG